MTNLPKVSDLTPDQVRVMIGEMLGKTFCAEKEHDFSVKKGGTESHPNWYIWQCSKCRAFIFPDSPHRIEISEEDALPDYPRDLNATADMEKSLVGDSAPENDELMEKYVEALHDLTGADLNPSAVAIFATADQRARAFLVAKGRARL